MTIEYVKPQRKVELRPNPSPGWVKETLCEDAADAATENGAQLTARQVEITVAASLERYEAEQRERKNVARSMRPKNPAADMAADSGAEFTKRPLIDDKILREAAREAALFRTMGPKHRAIRQRMLELMRGAPADPIYPAFCREIVQLYADYGLSVGKFRGMAKSTAERIIARTCEEIAERSNAIPGLGDWKRGVT